MAVFDLQTFTLIQQQIRKIEDQTRFLERQLKQLNPDQYQWSSALSLINQLGNLMQRSNAISYSVYNIEQRFTQHFPGYKPPQNYIQNYQTMVNASQQTINNTLVNFGMSAKDFENENRRLEFLQQQSQTVEGQVQAIQVANQLASEQITQLQLLRQTIMAQSSSMDAYYAIQIQDEAYKRAELIQVLKAGSTKIVEYGSSGDDFKVPEF